MQARSAAQAIDAIRRGWPVRVEGVNGALDLLAVETATDASLAAFCGEDSASLLISFERAVTLKLVNQLGAASPQPVAIALERPASVAAALAIADPSRDLATPLKGPFVTARLGAWDAGEAAIVLARHGGLLPAFFMAPASTDVVATDVAAVAAYADPGTLVIAARAALPIATAEPCEIVAFRSVIDAREHIALVIGTRDDTAPVVRLHSECLTGDVFGSLKCDCGPQLDSALGRIAGAQWGILLYLRQEGRGIGLINKLRAYELQDQGFDTVDANVRLGFPIEARDFAIAARMLDALSVQQVRLLTNNPAKVERLVAEGIKVMEHLPLALASNHHNESYLATKRDRTGHQL